MTDHPVKQPGLFGALARYNQVRLQHRHLDAALADPHLARDIGLPHRPRATANAKVYW